MTSEFQVLLAILLPLAGAAGIAIAGRHYPNLRETVTLITASCLALTVWTLLPDLLAGERPSVIRRAGVVVVDRKLDLLHRLYAK